MTAAYQPKDALRQEAQHWRISVEQALRTSGQHLTVPRRAILDWIAEQDQPFTAETLAAELEARKGISSRATVYRLLDWLREAAWIERVALRDERRTYARRMPGHQHQAICTRCGATVVLDGCGLDPWLADALATSGFAPRDHTLAVYGLCARCRATESERGEGAPP